jgi:8-oxo-dGTP pyrophosphatase MutT (NUDIX family)
MSVNPSTAFSPLPNFDPREVPVLGADSHLPPVARHWLLPQALRQRFASPPQWQPELMQEKRFTNRQEANASVLLPIVMRGPEQDQPTVLLTRRTARMSTHSGQIAFPGGKADPTDADAAATALREAQEEVGLAPEFVQVLGLLPTYKTGTAFVITPVVALVRPDFRLTINPIEVDEAFEVPLDFLMNPAHHRRHALDWQGVRREWFSMPYQDERSGKEHFIWGATAGMLRNFYRFLAA